MGLSQHLIASFWEIEKNQNGIWEKVGDISVKAPLTEATMEMVLNWQSPFEQAGAESKAPTLSAMLQSGALQPYVNSDGKAGSMFSKFEGRTGITKLNSTQVFSGMPPVKIQVTALFRAWLDPAKEVEAPFNQLMAWALPVNLAPDGAIMSLLSGIKAVAAGTALSEAAVNALLPSTAPCKIAMKYKGRIYQPLVIESITHPMNSPIDANGQYVELAVPMTLCTLTAIDRADWSNSKKPM